MPSMGWVNQGEQHIDIEEKSHGSSSRSALTISSATMTPCLRTGKSGTPFRSAGATGGRNELRASSETILPIV